MTHRPLKLLDYFYLFAVLTGIGISDFCMKVFNHCRPNTEKELFLFSVFIFSFIYSAGLLWVKNIRFEKSTFLRGTVLGIPNIFSSFFLLGALAELPAILVYPVVNIGTILLTTIAAMQIWKEKLNKHGIWALVMGSISIILLSMY